MPAVAIYEVRGRHPDHSLSFHALKRDAEKEQKESKKTRLLAEHQVFLTGRGVAEFVNLLYRWQDHGLTTQAEPNDVTLRKEVDRLKALVRTVYDEADLLEIDEVEDMINED